MDKDRFHNLLYGFLIVAYSLLSGCNEGPALKLDTLEPPMGSKFPPLVLESVTPEEGAVKVSIRPRFVLRFNNQIDSTSLLVNTSTGQCLGSVQVSKDDFYSCITLVPAITYDGGFSWEIWAANNLDILTNYKIKISGEIKDVIGSNLTNPYLSTLGFLTEDNVPPEVASTIPPPGAVDVDENTDISITFSKPINPQTISTNIGSEGCSGSLQVSANGFFSCIPMVTPQIANPDFTTFTLRPLMPLKSETTYQIRALESIEDFAGNNLKAQYVGAGFKVKDWIKPTVSNTFPQAYAVEVPLNTPVIISFSEEMNPNTITVNSTDINCSGSLQLSKDNFTTCIRFSGNPVTTNGISYTITPDGDLEQGSLYQIKVTQAAEDLAGNPLESESTLPGFTTVALPYVVSITPPSGVKDVPYEATVTVTFNKSMDASSVFTDPNSDSCDVASLVVSSDDFSTCVPMEVAVPSNGNRTFTTKAVGAFSDQAILQVKIAKTVRDPLGYSPESDYIQDPPWQIIDTTPPEILLTIPEDEQKDVVVSATLTVDFNERMDVDSLSGVQTFPGTCIGPIQLSLDDFSTCIGFNSSIPNYSPEQTLFTLTPTLILETGTNYKFKVTTAAKDTQGNHLVADNEFAFSTVPDLEVLETIPPDSLTPLVLRDTNITVTFNRSMDPAYMTANTTDTGCTGSIQVVKNGATCVTFTSDPVPNLDGTIWTLDPASDLDNFTEYKIKVTQAARDTYGSNLKTEYQQVDGFKTEDTIAPTLVLIVPSDGDTLVPHNSDIVVTFDEPMNPSSITANATDTTCWGSIQVSEDDFRTCVRMDQDPASDAFLTQWTVKPLSILKNFTVYKVKVTNAAEDLQGNNLENTFEQTTGFKTIDTIPPVVVATIPASGTTQVPVNTTITINFDEPIDLSTITFSNDGSCIGSSIQVQQGPDFTTCLPLAFYIPSNNDQDFTFTQTNSLNNDGTIYKIVATTDIQDTQGNALQTDFNSSFRAVDEVPPTIDVSSLAPTGVNIAINRALTVEFSEDMDVSTIITNGALDTSCAGKSWYAMEGAGPNCIEMNPFTTPDNTAFTMTPVNFWERARTFTVTLTDVISDPVGATITNPQSYMFTTSDPGQVTTTSPTDGAIEVLLDSMIDITWDRAMDNSSMTLNSLSNTCAGFDIQVSNDNFATSDSCLRFANSTADPQVPETYRLDPYIEMVKDTTYTVKVTTSVVTSASPTGWPVDQTFSFTTIVPPNVLTTVPTNLAENVSRSTNIEITFTKVMDPLSITGNATDTTCWGNVLLSEDPAFTTSCVQFSGTATSSDSRRFTFTPNIPLGDAKKYYLKVTTGVVDTVGQNMEADYTSDFETIDDVPPVVIAQTPPNSATNTIPNTSISAIFNEAIDTSTVTTTITNTPCNNLITFQISTDGFTTCLGTTPTSFSNDDQTISATPIRYLPDSTTAQSRILSTVSDVAGNQMGTDTSWLFVTGDAPKVDTILPTDGQDYVPIDTSIVLNFNKDINATTVNFDTDASCTSGNAHLSTDVNFEPGNCIPFSTIVWSSPTQASLTISAPLNQVTEYYFKLDNSVTDLEWNLSMEDNFNSSFTTLSLVPPTVGGTIPVNGSTNIGEDQVLQILFDKPMNVSTVTTGPGCTGNVQLVEQPSGTCHPLNTPTSSSGDTIFIITPSSPYGSYTDYKIKVIGPGGVEDKSGNNMVSDFIQTFGFTTGDTIPPTLLSSSPVAGTNTDTNPLFMMEFSEPMDPWTVTTYNGILTAPCPATDSVGFLLAEDAAFTTCVPMTTNTGTTGDNINFSFILAQGLKNQTDYWYLISTRVTDTAGNNMATSTVVQFRVDDPNDNFPTILSPPDKATNVNYDNGSLILSLNFSKLVDPGSVTNNSSGIGCSGSIQLLSGASNFTTCEKFATAPSTIDDQDFNLGALDFPLVPNTTYILKVDQSIANQLSPPAYPTLRNDYYFSFTTASAPGVVAMNPPSGTTGIAVDGSLTVQFDSQMDSSSITGAPPGGECTGSVDVTISASYFTCHEFSVEDLDGGYTFKLTPKAPYQKNTTYLWRVDSGAKDINGFSIPGFYPNNLGQNFTVGNFISVVSTTPADRAVNQSTSPAFDVTFSETMQNGTVNTNYPGNTCTGSIQLSKDDFGTCWRLSLTTSSNSLNYSFTGRDALQAGNYTVKVTTDAKSLQESTLEGDFTWRFSTGVPPEISLHMPSNGDTNIPLNSSIFIQFSETMSGSTIFSNNGNTDCTGSVQLKVQGATNCVPLGLITNSNFDNYTINPVSLLNASTTYEVLVTKDAQSQVNIPMWDDVTWSFTTAASLASFEDNKDEFYGKGMRCTPSMEVNENKGKKVKVSWKQNREKLVNSLGGGYEVFYKKGNEFFCKKIRYIDGEWAPNETSLNLTSGRWYLRVKGYSRLNKDGSAFSKVITLEIP